MIFEEADGKKLRIRSGGIGNPIKDFPDAAVIGGPYSSVEQAKEAVERVKAALLAWAVRQRVGIDFGDGRLRGVVTSTGIKMFEEMYKRPVRNDVHGVDIYEHKDGMVFVRMNAQFTLGKDPTTFVGQFSETFGQHPVLTEKQLLAFELYCASSFDVSLRSRLITLVTSIEAVLELAERSELDKAIVENMSELVRRSAMLAETKESFMGSLQWLKYESIRQSGRKLVKRLLGSRDYGGMSAERFFIYCYDLRSQILHTGKPEKASIDLLNVTNTLQEFVSALLIASLGMLVV
ncbi:MAG: hypothetical protein ABSG44_01875 [Thermodesulfobacteriota bacterium]